MCLGHDTSVRQHYKSEHWAACHNQTPSWYDWKFVESDVKPENIHTHTHDLNTGSRQWFCYQKVRSCGVSFIWATPSEFGTYRLCEQWRFRRACASAQSRQNLRCSLIQAVSQEEPSYGKPDPWPLWMAGHARLKFVMTECSKTQIRLAGLILIRSKNISSSFCRQQTWKF